MAISTLEILLDSPAPAQPIHTLWIEVLALASAFSTAVRMAWLAVRMSVT